MRLIVVSGLSGAGKSIALHALEDHDYYGVDNLPMKLLPAFAEQMHNAGESIYGHVAVGIDGRNPVGSLKNVPAMLDRLRNAGLECEVIYLQASEEVLIKRYSETRRKHPLMSENMSLLEAIRREKELLVPLADHADIHIDTSHFNLYQLRDLIRERVVKRASQSLSLLFMSFGFKHGVPPDADFVFDARCLPNPYWEAHLRSMSGRDKPVIEFLERDAMTAKFVDQVGGFLESWLPGFETSNRAYLTVATGCTGGQHRSVYVAEKLAERFSALRDGVLVRHREIGG